MMELAAVILSTIALCVSIACLVLMLAKNFFSTHVIQREMVDPFKALAEQGMPAEMLGKPVADPFRELGDPIDSEELERISELRRKKLRV